MDAINSENQTSSSIPSSANQTKKITIISGIFALLSSPFILWGAITVFNELFDPFVGTGFGGGVFGGLILLLFIGVPSVFFWILGIPFLARKLYQSSNNTKKNNSVILLFVLLSYPIILMLILLFYYLLSR